MQSKVKVAVIGGGSWATAIVKMLCENLNEVGWYMRSAYIIEHIKLNKHNPNYLSSASFDPNKLFFSEDINEMILYADYIIFAVPSAFVQAELNKIRVPLNNKVIFSAIKGIVPESGLIVGEHFHEKMKVPFENIGVITGPCHAEEVAMERLSYLTIACQDETKAEVLAGKLSSRYIKTKISDDIIGTEYAAMLKNIFAVAAGMAHGLGYGDNFQAVLISSSIREIEKFIDAVHPIHRDTKTSAYLGDLLVTAYSKFSRNRSFGFMIGKGYSLKTAQMEMNMIAEGYYAVNSLAKVKDEFKVEMPILECVYSILYENASARKKIKELTEILD